MDQQDKILLLNPDFAIVAFTLHFFIFLFHISEIRNQSTQTKLSLKCIYIDKTSSFIKNQCI